MQVAISRYSSDFSLQPHGTGFCNLYGDIVTRLYYPFYLFLFAEWSVGKLEVMVGESMGDYVPQVCVAIYKYVYICTYYVYIRIYA